MVVVDGIGGIGGPVVGGPAGVLVIIEPYAPVPAPLRCLKFASQVNLGTCAPKKGIKGIKATENRRKMVPGAGTPKTARPVTKDMQMTVRKAEGGAEREGSAIGTRTESARCVRQSSLAETSPQAERRKRQGERPMLARQYLVDEEWDNWNTHAGLLFPLGR